jgi:hypothetical protein
MEGGTTMVRVITNGDTARIVLERTVSGSDQVGEVVAGVRDCADAGVEELLIAVPQIDERWLEVLEHALTDTDPLRIWVAVGEPDPDVL